MIWSVVLSGVEGTRETQGNRSGARPRQSRVYSGPSIPSTPDKFFQEERFDIPCTKYVGLLGGTVCPIRYRRLRSLRLMAVQVSWIAMNYPPGTPEGAEESFGNLSLFAEQERERPNRSTTSFLILFVDNWHVDRSKAGSSSGQGWDRVLVVQRSAFPTPFHVKQYELVSNQLSRILWFTTSTVRLTVLSPSPPKLLAEGGQQDHQITAAAGRVDRNETPSPNQRAPGKPHQ